MPTQTIKPRKLRLVAATVTLAILGAAGYTVAVATTPLKTQHPVLQDEAETIITGDASTIETAVLTQAQPAGISLLTQDTITITPSETAAAATGADLKAQLSNELGIDFGTATDSDTGAGEGRDGSEAAGAGADTIHTSEHSSSWVNNENQHSIASITKVITALVGLEALAANGHTIESFGSYAVTADTLQITAESALLNGSVVDVAEGTTLTGTQLLQLMMLPSANNFAIAYSRWIFGSDAAFLAQAQQWLAAKGLSSTVIVDAAGRSPENRSTVRDLLRLGELAMLDPQLAAIVAQPSADIPGFGTVYNTNTVLQQGLAAGVKTGTLDSFNLLTATWATLPDQTGALWNGAALPHTARAVLGDESLSGQSGDARAEQKGDGGAVRNGDSGAVRNGDSGSAQGEAAATAEGETLPAQQRLERRVLIVAVVLGRADAAARHSDSVTLLSTAGAAVANAQTELVPASQSWAYRYSGAGDEFRAHSDNPQPISAPLLPGESARVTAKVAGEGGSATVEWPSGYTLQLPLRLDGSVPEPDLLWRLTHPAEVFSN